MKKKSIILFTVFCLSTLLFTGCGKSSDGANTGNLKFWTWTGNEDVLGIKTGDIEALQILADETNQQIDWVNPADPSTEFNMFMTSGKDLPDALMYKYTPQTMSGYAKNGRLVDLSPYLESDLPNFKKLLDENENLKKQVVSPDGKIYYLPWITEEKYFYEGLMLREDWLNATGLAVPTTNDELYKVLKAEKDLFDQGKLPNAGDKFYGLSGYPQQLIKLAYGFEATNDFMLDENNNVVFGPTTDGYREAMIWFNKLYNEGLLDPDVLSYDADVYKAHHVNNQTAGYIDNYGNFQGVEVDNGVINYVPVGYMKNKDGEILDFNSTAKRVAQPYGWAVTTQDEERLKSVLSVFDYVYSEDGQTLLNWGVEGETFTMDDSGEKMFTDLIMDDPQFPPAVAAGLYTKPDLGMSDTQVIYAQIDQRGVETFNTWANVDTSRAMEPTLWTTEDENEVITNYLTDILTIRDENQEKFIINQLDPTDDAVWNTYQDQLKSASIELLTKTYNSAYKRFVES